MRNSLIFGLILCLLLCSCNDDDDDVPFESACDKFTTINHEKFKNVNPENYTIVSAKIDSDCLEIVLSSGGCDGNSWNVELIDADRIAETLIEQRDLIISLTNHELCNAIIQKTFSFDLTPIRTNQNQLILNLEKWGEQIKYAY